ncbi:MAG: protein-glutamate O-methyltransferase CheR [bacterium]|nr:protein-glutamate O-methyltransferase CheR [bacterium]
MDKPSEEIKPGRESVLEPPLQMSDEDFRSLRDFINHYCGIYFDVQAKFLLERRLSQQLRAHRMRNFRDYYFYLKYDPHREEELNTLAEILTTNETYFFREDYQLQALTEEIVPEIVEARKNEPYPSSEKSLRIWSAGCSSGEEPYTLAMLTKDHLALKRWAVEIFASDISNRVLTLARKGVYRESAFRATQDVYRRAYFETTEEGFRVRDEVRRLVTFGHLNLLDEERIKMVKPQDLIMCRNVIIYFDRESRRRVIKSFFDRLRPGGFLLLGHSESLMNLSTDFILRHFKHDMVYQKPGPGAPPGDAK